MHSAGQAGDHHVALWVVLGPHHEWAVTERRLQHVGVGQPPDLLGGEVST